MTTLTIRGLDDAVIDALKSRSRAHGRSTEAELRQIITRALEEPATPERSEVGLGTRIHERFAGLGWEGVERIQELPRPVQFDE